MQRNEYTAELDEDRKAAGWGEHYWLRDGRTGARLRLDAARDLEQTVRKLNGPAAYEPTRLQ